MRCYVLTRMLDSDKDMEGMAKHLLPSIQQVFP
jgi:hypothetical protein